MTQDAHPACESGACPKQGPLCRFWNYFMGPEPLAPPVKPQGLLGKLPPMATIVIGHLLALLSGVAGWNAETRGGLHRVLFLFEPEEKDIKRLLTYVPVYAALFLVPMHLAAWWAARKQATPNYRAGLAAMAGTMWPLFLTALGLLGLWYVNFEKRDPHDYIWSGPLCLAVGMMVWQFFEWFPGYLPRTEPGCGEPRRCRRELLMYALPMLGLTLAYCLWFSYIGVMRHVSFGTCIHDFSLYDQLLWNGFNGHWFEVGCFNDATIGYNLRDFDNHFYAEHFIPSFFIIYPIFWLFPSTKTLIICHAFLAGMAAIPAYLIARRKLQSPMMAVLWGAAFLVHPLTQAGTIKDVHVDTFAPLFLLAAYACYVYGHRAFFLALLLVAMGCKEEISVAVVAMGMFIFLGERDWKMGLATMALGAAYFVAVVGFLIPSYRGGEAPRQFYRYNDIIPPEWGVDPMDITPGLMLKAMIVRPVLWINALIQEERVRGFLMLVAPYALMSFWGRWTWLWIWPPLAIALLSNQLTQHALQQQYGTPHIASMTVGSIIGLVWLLRRDLPRDAPLPMPRLAAGITALGLAVFFAWKMWAFMPGGDRYRAADYEVMPHNEIGYKFLAAIPEDARVSAQIELGPQLTPRRFFYMWPTILDAEYMWIDTRSLPWPVAKNYETLVRAQLNDPEWGLIMPYEDGHMLFKKGHSNELNDEALEQLDFTPYRRRARYGATW